MEIVYGVQEIAVCEEILKIKSTRENIVILSVFAIDIISDTLNLASKFLNNTNNNKHFIFRILYNL